MIEIFEIKRIFKGEDGKMYIEYLENEWLNAEECVYCEIPTITIEPYAISGYGNKLSSDCNKWKDIVEGLK